MCKLKSWSKLFVLVLLVFLFTGCGGGSSDNSVPDNSEQTTNTEPETAPTPNTPDNGFEIISTPNSNDKPAQPQPDTTQPEVTPTPTVPDTNTPSYTDTYDIASILDGNWRGVSGSGTAAQGTQTFSLLMYSNNVSIVKTQITGNTGTAYVTYRQSWDYNNPNSIYTTRISIYGDAEQATLVHTGVDTWRLEFSSGVTATMMFISEKEAIVTQEGPQTMDGITYNYLVRYTITK